MARGHLTIVAGPSGSGKSTLIKRFLKDHPAFRFPTSVTTRKAREGEVHGDHYFFVSREEFKRRIDDGDFLEWAAVYGKYYGTLKSTIFDALTQSTLLLKDIDIQGAKSLMDLLDPKDLTSIFISPPSLEELKRRLQKRDSETPETLNNRLAEAEVEMHGMDLFGHVIVNGDLEKSYNSFSKIILSSH